MWWLKTIASYFEGLNYYWSSGLVTSGCKDLLVFFLA